MAEEWTVIREIKIREYSFCTFSRNIEAAKLMPYTVLFHNEAILQMNKQCNKSDRLHQVHVYPFDVWYSALLPNIKEACASVA